MVPRQNTRQIYCCLPQHEQLVFWIPCMEYCCHIWASAPSCYLELLDKLLKRICRTVCPSLAASLEPLAHRRNVASLSLFYRYYFGRCSSELSQLVQLPFSRGRSLCYSDKFHDFIVTIPKCYKDVYFNSFFVILFLVTPCFVVAVQPCTGWIPIIKKEHFFFPLEEAKSLAFSAIMSSYVLIFYLKSCVYWIQIVLNILSEFEGRHSIALFYFLFCFFFCFNIIDCSKIRYV